MSQFEIANSKLDVMFLCNLFITWAGPVALARCATKLEQAVESLTIDEWYQVMRAADDESPPRDEATREVSISVDQLPETVTPRTVAAIGLRGNLKTTDKLFEKHLASYNGEDEMVLRFCQSAALRMLARNLESWDAQLPIISQCYLKGVVSHQLPRQMRHHGAALIPLQVAKRIVERADRFPGELVTASEWVCRQELTSKIEPVGVIAGRDGWFEC
jgi:hypothetical protein